MQSDPTATRAERRDAERATRRSRARRGFAATTALSISLLGSVVVMPQAAVAGPAPSAGLNTVEYPTAGQAFSGVVPDGACAVTATVVGGSGGRSAAGANGSGANGAGASITATFAVLPQSSYSGSVGGAGQMNVAVNGGAGGANGGGAGGTGGQEESGDHGGAGGGGYSALFLGGTADTDLAVLAGGGGGSGGGHSTTTDGFGGNAGMPTAAGIASGDAGTNGKDVNASYTVGGGAGGSTVGGAGGQHSSISAWNGQDGSSLQGGAGGPDPDYDAGGGGGGGYFGGGGGASTDQKNTDGGVNDVAGAGGGGGSSYVAAGAEGVTSTPFGKMAGTGAGANGSVTLDWIPCDYDLEITKTVDDETPLIGDTIEWTITVVNNGDGFMTRGDTVTITDSLPGAGAKTITEISVSGGSNSVLDRGAVTCTAGVGGAVVAVDSTMPTTLECSRPFQVTGEPTASGLRGLDVGETLTITYEQEITDAVDAVLTNTATVTDRGDTADNTSTDTSTVTANPPVADDDSDLLNTIGDAVTVDALDGDTAGTGALVPGSVRILNGATPVTELDVPGEGTWTVNTTTGAITFAPEAGFEGDPTVISYRISDVNELSDDATVTVTYQPAANDDSDTGNTIAQTVLVPVLENDLGAFDLTTLSIVGASDPTSLIVAGEGSWTVHANGVIGFTPETGFVTDPTPIEYRVTDAKGVAVTAEVVVEYVPVAVNDFDLGNTVGDTVDVPVLVNDLGSFDASTLRIVGGSNGGATLQIVGQGTWSVAGSSIRFVPEVGYMGDPMPVRYAVEDVTGDEVEADVTVTYVPVAADDSDLGNVLGTPVALNPLANDTGDFDETSVRILVAGTPVTDHVVAGEGTWSVDAVTGIVTFTPESSFVGNPTPVDYRVTDVTGDVVEATITVTYLPEAANDSSLRNTPGTPVTVDPIGNDSGVFDPTSVYLIDEAGNRVRTMRVAGQGTWTVNATTGAITFTPQAGYFSNPTPVDYEVTDTLRGVVEATVTVTYLPTASNDVSTDNKPGTPVTLDVVGNDDGDLIPGSVVLIDEDGNRVMTLRVPGEGTWTVNPTTGAITFTPQAGFTGNPTPVSYEVTDIYGETTEALAEVTYTAPAMPVTGSTDAMPVLLGGAGALLLGAVLLMVSRRRGTVRTGRHTA